MILASPQKIQQHMRSGVWGTTTLDDLFRAAVIGARDRLAIIDAPDKLAFMGMPPLRLTWIELAGKLDRLCQRLLSAGIRRDEIVGVQLPNCVELALVYLAAARLGFIVSPFAIQYREHELADLIPFAGITAFITARSIKGHDHAEMLRGLSGRAPGLRTILAFGGLASPGIETLDGLDNEPLDRLALAAAAERAAVRSNDIVTITWTSGTEARPKGVPRSHNYWICAGLAVAEAGLLEEGGVLLNPFPMAHVGSLGGMFFPWLIKRGVLVQHQPFDLERFLQQIQDERVTYTVAPPAVLNLLMQNDALRARYDLTSLTSVGSGSAPLAPWMIQGFQDQHGISVWNTFGSSEGCALFGTSREVPDAGERAHCLPRLGVPGIDWPSYVSRMQETRLVDLATGEVISKAGQAGEIRLRGALVFDGYWNAPEITADAFDADGFYKTGDIFEITGSGPVPRYYRYIGRASDVINRGGMKISPAEIEALIDSHPKVRESALIGVPDGQTGERACAIVALRTDEPLSLAELIAFLKEKQVAVYKLPERLETVALLPRNPVGKVLKRELRARYRD